MGVLLLTQSALAPLLGSSSRALLGLGSSLLGCRQLFSLPPRLMRWLWGGCWLIWGLPAGQKLGILRRRLTRE